MFAEYLSRLKEVDSLLTHPVLWSKLDDPQLKEKLQGHITVKVTDYLGFEEEDLIAHITAKLWDCRTSGILQPLVAHLLEAMGDDAAGWVGELAKTIIQDTEEMHV